MPPTPSIVPHWYGDIARAVDYVGVLGGLDSGYILDDQGGVHPWGNAPGGSPILWPGDYARAMVPYNSGIGSGYVLDLYGGVTPFGGAPAKQSQGAYWSPLDVGRGIAIWPSGTTGYYVNILGSLQTFVVLQPPCCAPVRK